jgi:hypothetical protein
MRKTITVLVTVTLMLAMLTIGLANASPRLLKECNMVYWTSDDPTALPVPGNQVSGFKLTLDKSVEWYYLDAKFVKPTYAAGNYMFWLTPPDDESPFWDYWYDRGVYQGCPGTWQPVMWLIIHGGPAFGQPFVQLPMFSLHSDGEGNYDLYDGLLRFTGTPGQTLRINGDYPKGTYTFTCLGAAGPNPPYPTMANPLEGLKMTITFR